MKMTYNEVDADKLLEGLKNDTSERTLAHVASETLDVGRSTKRLLVLVVGLDLFQLGENVWAVGR